MESPLVMLLLLVACSDQAIYIGGDLGKDTAGMDDGTPADSDTGDPQESVPDTSMWDDARLVVTSPSSGAFLPWGDPAAFRATVYDAAGQPTDFDDIVWTSDIDPSWTLTGASVDDASLDVGTHALTAEARLPNDDRLAYTVGGVLVQSPYTGIYSGTLTVDASGDYNGTTYTLGCSGAITMTVDAYGELATGDASCVLSLFGYDLDTSYALELQNTDGALDGTAALDLVWTAYDIDSAGTITEDGQIEGSFAADVLGFLQLEGTYEATRISRDVSEE